MHLFNSMNFLMPILCCSETNQNFDIDAINNVQWKLICDFHCGDWKGVQTGYDPRNIEAWKSFMSLMILLLT